MIILYVKKWSDGDDGWWVGETVGAIEGLIDGAGVIFFLMGISDGFLYVSLNFLNGSFSFTSLVIT